MQSYYLQSLLIPLQCKVLCKYTAPPLAHITVPTSLSPSISPIVFHSRLKTHPFYKSFPTQSCVSVSTFMEIGLWLDLLCIGFIKVFLYIFFLFLVTYARLSWRQHQLFSAYVSYLIIVLCHFAWLSFMLYLLMIYFWLIPGRWCFTAARLSVLEVSSIITLKHKFFKIACPNFRYCQAVVIWCYMRLKYTKHLIAWIQLADDCQHVVALLYVEKLSGIACYVFTPFNSFSLPLTSDISI